ncbi:M17 family metallopeptidase [uncultured Thiothrix sp.]|uniref:leucyl aminopeptidase family protein n=1 Tax=uncultured Thiothrix sp. TaxID=223185 RepID=UPI002626628D|nr:leucyl aminopeptidase family protein [uncultured Thiothrix sp.]
MFTYEKTETAIPIRLVTETSLAEIKTGIHESGRNWLTVQGYRGKPNTVSLVPDSAGRLVHVFYGLNDSEGMLWALAGLPNLLPTGEYFLEGDWNDEDLTQMLVGWGLGHYRFDQFRTTEEPTKPILYVSQGAARINAMVEAISLVRNLINMPANHMMPQDLEQVARRLAEVHDAEVDVITGSALLKENFPTIHAVGRASVHAPRLIELNWGNQDDPLVCLVGKGVCFDTGGLDIKPSSNMRLMKKDMGGAAHVLGLAKLIMQLELPICLQVLIPAVDNAISGDAFRPGDVLHTRLGKTVEIDNTDAEGRLILCDALAYAAENDPDVIIDFATLTGAARVAMGTEVPAFFANDRSLMQKLQAASTMSNDLIWNLPLHKPYLEKLRSQVADLSNSGDSYGGAITAALFLNEFVPNRIPWAHFDVMAWNLRARPGRPIGGEAMGLFAVFKYLEMNFAE